jgi:hypothetical protein
MEPVAVTKPELKVRELRGLAVILYTQPQCIFVLFFKILYFDFCRKGLRRYIYIYIYNFIF